MIFELLLEFLLFNFSFYESWISKKRVSLCARGEMDITIDYGSVVRGSNPCGRTKAALIVAANMLSVRRISFGHARECAPSVSAPQAQHLDYIYQRSLTRRRRRCEIANL